MISPELQQKIAGWRQKALDGTITIEEQREALKLMREGRLAAAQASAAGKRAKAKAAVPNADDLLSELDDIEEA
jgi:hypothetical protein